MKEKEILYAFGDVEDRFLEEAAPVARKKPAWRRWTAVAAACLALVAVASVFALQKLPQNNGRYQYSVTQKEAAAIVLRWEDRTLSERYLEMRFDGILYSTRGLAIDPSYLGAELGTCDAWGFDHYTEKTYHQDFAVYEIAGIQNEKLVAVCMEGVYYVFRQDGYAPPATLGELMNVYNLAENLPLTRFSHDDAYYTLEDDTAIWQILAECADAPVVENGNFTHGEKDISFTITSEALGIYKRVFYVTADGYVKTNALDYGYVYHIGADAAQRILEYALTKGEETEMEPYTNFVAGTITEIGDGYILVDDTALCRNEEDGVEFKVLSSDPVFSRWLKYNDFKVGDVVYIQYRGEVAEGNVIAGAFSISEAILGDGHILVPE